MNVRPRQRRDLLAFEDGALGQAALAALEPDVGGGRPYVRRARDHDDVVGVLVAVIGREDQRRPTLVHAYPVKVTPPGSIHPHVLRDRFGGRRDAAGGGSSTRRRRA